MDLRRLRAGEWLTGAAGALLIWSLFLPWYRPAGPSGATDALGTVSFSAFEVLGAIDVLALILGAAAIAVVLLAAASPSPAAPIAAQALLTVFALVASVVVLIRVLVVPRLAAGVDPPIELERGAWAWIGAIAALGVLVGAVVAMRDERRSRPTRATDATGRPVASVLEVESLPAPPAAGTGA